MLEIIHHPAGDKRLGDLLIDNFRSSNWTVFRAAIAFVKRSGTKHIALPLAAFSARASVRISLGIDHCGTSFEGAEDLLTALGTKGELWIFHNEASPTFHPKIYLFSNETAAEAFIGSGNLTEGGLFTNYEAFVYLRLNRVNANDEKTLKQIEDLLDIWISPEDGTARKADYTLLAELKARADLPSEAEINRVKVAREGIIKGGVITPATKLFASVPVKLPPRVTPGSVSARDATIIAPLKSQGTVSHTGFCITLQNTDVGVGQKTAGAARRAAELFVPKACVHADPEFWGWPNLFQADPKWQGPRDRDGFGKMDRRVRMRFGPTTLSVNWGYNPDKRDYRMRNEALRSAGNVGDILRIESVQNNDEFDYYVEIIPKGTSQFERFAAVCTESVRNSLKKWGYY